MDYTENIKTWTRASLEEHIGLRMAGGRTARRKTRVMLRLVWPATVFHTPAACALSLGHHQNLKHCWHHGTRHTCKVS